MTDDQRAVLEEQFNNYGKTTTTEVKELLSKIAIIKKGHKGVGTIFGYYKVSDKIIRNIINYPRSVDFGAHCSFGSNHLVDLVTDMVEYKEIDFLSKGEGGGWPNSYNIQYIEEVFDQMSDEEKATTKGICIDEDVVAGRGVKKPGTEHLFLSEKGLLGKAILFK